MYLSIQLFICVTFFLIACFFLGKKLGERKFNKIHDELKAYETSLNHLIDQIELVSSHNLKILGAKTDEIRELMPIIDKKVLYVNDLFSELEAMKQETSMKISGMKNDQPIDLKLRREIQEMLNEIKGRFKAIETRIELLEKIDQENRLCNVSVVSSASRHFPTTEHIPIDREKPKSTEGIAHLKIPQTALSKPGQEEAPSALPVAVAEKVAQPASHPVVESSSIRRLKPFLPRPGSVLNEVLALHKKGVTLPQIARQLNMEHGEVEVIMNIYGSRQPVAIGEANHPSRGDASFANPPLRKVT